ncbi:hypothetical protein [Deminuibacter soli]|nr:hypothetical protein [Deminuibacter soli]
MEFLWSSEIDKILNIGLLLKDVGVNNWALTKSQALHAVDEFLCC